MPAALPLAGQTLPGRHRAPIPEPRPDTSLRRAAAAVRRPAARALVVLLTATALPFALSGAAAQAATTADWEKLAQCESGGNWSINTGNGYYGGLQFSQSTWLAYNGDEFASRADYADPEEQMVVANRTLAAQGWDAWPSCSRSVGLYGSPTTGGPTQLITAITDRYNNEPAIRNRMGSPLGFEQGDAQLRWQVYQGGRMYWSPSAGAHTIYGAILAKYLSLGGAPTKGVPTTDELGASGGGAYNDFAGNGSIYWSRSTGAHEVRGAIRAKWRSLGAERTHGYPLTDEVPSSDGGAYNDFNSMNSIYWSRATNSHEVRGSIRATWRSLGGPKSRLGYPVSDEYSTRYGARSDFQGGYVAWKRSTNQTKAFYN
ncbi:MAG: transglycosylase family protein [Geodermatophilaceae bacterium]